jgi:ketosteroid isomerase-like protein
MSEENVEVVRSIYSEWERGNMTPGLGHFDQQIMFESFMPDSTERVVVQGLDAIAGFMQEFLAQWRDYRMVGEEFREVGNDTVFVRGRQAGTGRQSGAAVESPAFSTWTFRDGKVVRLVFERYEQAALEAAGLSE